MLIINKILIFFIVFSSLIIFRDTLSFVSHVISGNTNKDEYTNTRLIVFGISMSYLLTMIITGLKVI